MRCAAHWRRIVAKRRAEREQAPAKGKGQAKVKLQSAMPYLIQSSAVPHKTVDVALSIG